MNTPWMIHAGCLREGLVRVPAGAHELLLIMRGPIDLLGPEPGQVFRLVSGAILFNEVDRCAADRLKHHLSGSIATSEFRLALAGVLALGHADEIEGLIDDWIDAHVSVVFLPVTLTEDHALAGRYHGYLNHLPATCATERLG